MPNHTTNLLTIHAPSEAVIDQIIQAVRKEGKNDRGEDYVLHFSCDRIVPRPEFIADGALSMEAESATPGRNWYDWNQRKWGTKWGTYEAAEPVKEGRIVTFRFQSAWSPPTPVIQELAMLFPDASMRLQAIDEGFCWACELTISGESCVEQEIKCDTKDAAFAAFYERVYGEPLPTDE